MVYGKNMLETILTQLRHELLTRAPLDTLPSGVWRRTGALNTWGTNAIEGNTLTRKDVERILLEGRSVSNRSLPDVLETIQHEQAFESLLRRRTDAIRLSSVLELHDTEDSRIASVRRRSRLSRRQGEHTTELQSPAPL